MTSQDMHEQAVTDLSQKGSRAIAGALLSRLSGVIRTLIVNAVFGVNIFLDAFYTAFRFPNSLRDLFADGALSSAFMKALVDIQPEGQHATQTLIRMITGFFFTITFLLATVAAYYAAPFIKLISGQALHTRGSFMVTIHLFQLLIFYLPITMLNAVAMAVLGVQGKTFRAMNGAIFLSVGMIGGALLIAPLCARLGYLPIYGLAIGAMLGVILQLIYQLAPLLREGIFLFPIFSPRAWWHYQPLRSVIIMMIPRALGQGAMVLALIINTYFAINIAPGAISYISTAVIIIQVPIGLFGVANGFAALPMLTRLINEQKATHFSRLLIESLTSSSWLALFTASCFAFLLVPFFVVVMQHGKLTYLDTLNNCRAVCAYGMGIVFAAADKIMVNALYAVRNTRQLVYNALIYLLVNATLSYLLAPRLGILGLGLSFSLATMLDFYLNYFAVARSFKSLTFSGVLYQERPHFGIIFLLQGLFGFILCGLGDVLISYGWSYFANSYHSLTFFKAVVYCGLIGSGLLFLFGLAIYYRGPYALRRWLK